MVQITSTAHAQLKALERHFARLDRNFATVRMTEAVEIAAVRIEAKEGPFWSAPRPYPDLADLSWQWLKQGRYWIAFAAAANGYAITGIFFETANIPDRT